MSPLSNQSQLTEIILLRHATSTRERDGQWGRLYDAPLGTSYKGELGNALSNLGQRQVPRVHSSPLLRCTLTARHVFPDSEIILVDDLRAYHSGIFEGLTESEVLRAYPNYVNLPYKDRFLHPRFGEESIESQARRVSCGLEAILSADVEDVVVIVAHFSTINVIAHIALGNLDPRTFADGAFDIAPGDFLSLSVALPQIKDHLSELLKKE